ncbi:uncharacterized protein LOC105433313 [Pogonomyrmex barbatus]|uniref:Uncharacterized protein LOC105433313 n=1 Tax=Pogonomyrmex barbatus TaxID=144034 RepID=A0A6I9WUA9_9HYME|nr:uncharacterized protein LOC105433313 [Pogonomyrmex barbatus]
MSWPSVIIMITAIISMLISLFRFKELKMCLHKLSIVDDTLEILGMPKEYQRLHNWIIRTIIGWILLSLLLNMFDSFWLNYEYFSITRIFVPFVGNHLLHVNTLNGLIWGTILGYTGSRFQRVNDYIHILYSDLYKNNTEYIIEQDRLTLVNQQKMKAKEYKQYMWIIM